MAEVAAVQPQKINNLFFLKTPRLTATRRDQARPAVTGDCVTATTPPQPNQKKGPGGWGYRVGYRGLP